MVSGGGESPPVIRRTEGFTPGVVAGSTTGGGVLVSGVSGGPPIIRRTEGLLELTEPRCWRTVSLGTGDSSSRAVFNADAC